MEDAMTSEIGVEHVEGQLLAFHCSCGAFIQTRERKKPVPIVVRLSRLFDAFQSLAETSTPSALVNTATGGAQSHCFGLSAAPP
jgi:hypothetical protein